MLVSIATITTDWVGLPYRGTGVAVKSAQAYARQTINDFLTSKRCPTGSAGLILAGTIKFSDQLRVAETANTPARLSSNAEGAIYVKGDKFVIAFNDAGTMRYKYLDLTGAGVTWVHTTSAP